MSSWGKAKGAVKYIFVSVPANIFGVNTLRNNHKTISALYQTISNPMCPTCANGVLSVDGPHEQSDNPNLKYTWACNKCGFMLLGGLDKKSIASTLTSMRVEQSLSVFDGLETEDRKKLQRNHTIHSRIFFTASASFLIGFCYMIFQGNGLILSSNWFALAFLMFVLGLKKCLRAWQVENGVIFVKGAFKTWFNNEKWLR